MSSRKIIIGLDFDGVVAYNPFRIARLPITYVKKNIFGMKGTKFYIPKTTIEKLVWTIIHESSVFPAIGTGLLQELVTQKRIEAHLVTARYSFLQKGLYSWLDRHHLRDFFTTVTTNEQNEQPHLYKARVVSEKKFDYFIEDNLDIVTHLTKTIPNTKVLWIYNLLDTRFPYAQKYPHLGKALTSITDGKK